MSATGFSPTRSGSERIEIIDALRGFALLGIIIVHMTEQYYAGIPPEKYQTSSTPVDSIISGMIGLLIIGKFYMIFSFLFGLSFYIQLSKVNSDFRFLLKFTWRLLLLFLIGLVHHMHYRGDILTIYAMLGIILVLTYKLPDKYLLVLAVLLVLDIPAILTRIAGLINPSLSLDHIMHPDQSVLERYYDTFKSGTYLDLINANLADFKIKMLFQVWSGRLYITMGLFVLGYYAGKQKFFEDLAARKALIKKMIRIALWSLLGIVLTAFAVMAVSNALSGGLPQDTNITISISFLDLLNACLAVLYVCWFIQLFEKDKWRSCLMQFYAAGRMGLTTYLMQAAFGLLIYSTLGLGLIGAFGSTIAFGLAIVIFSVQIWISKVWLTYFHYGPIEWIWRCLTNFKVYPLLLKSEEFRSV